MSSLTPGGSSGHNDVAGHNRTHFDANAAQYDSKPGVAKLQEWLKKQFNSERRRWIGIDWADDDDDDLDEHGDVEKSKYGNNDKMEQKEKKSVKILDYAAGTGAVSQAVAPYATEILGIDISQGMVDIYNHKVYNQGISPSEMRCVRGDLLADEPHIDTDKGDEENFWRFDLVVVNASFHHFDNVDRAAARLAERLRPGGVLLVMDFKEHEPIITASSSSAPAPPPQSVHQEPIRKHGQGHTPAVHDTLNEHHEHKQHHHHHHQHQHQHGGHHNTVHHHGFSTTQIMKIFEGAGLQDIDVITLGGGLTWSKTEEGKESVVGFDEGGEDEEQGEVAKMKKESGSNNNLKFVRREIFMAKGVRKSA